jgi:hypothetical protein
MPSGVAVVVVVYRSIPHPPSLVDKSTSPQELTGLLFLSHLISGESYLI